MTGRASNGESTIFKGADGRWHGYVSVGYKLNGRLDRRHVSSMKRSLVVDKVRELERKRDHGTVTETSIPTVAAWEAVDERTFALESDAGLLDACPLNRQQLACSVRVHTSRLPCSRTRRGGSRLSMKGGSLSG